MTEQRDARAPGLVLLGAERASEDRLHAKHVEEAGAHVPRRPGERARRRRSASSRTGRTPRRRRACGSCARRSRKFGGDITALCPSRVRWKTPTSCSGSVVRQRLQQDPVDHREDGAVGADAERERDERHDREGRRLPEAATRVPDVLAHAVHGIWRPSAAKNVPSGFLDHCHRRPPFCSRTVATAWRAENTLREPVRSRDDAVPYADSKTNDSVFVQFSGSVTSTGAPTTRIADVTGCVRPGTACAVRRIGQQVRCRGAAGVHGPATLVPR